MITTTPKLRAVDLFCGAGGMTLGAERSGRVDVVLAVNHWRTAVLSHTDNHPNTRHICARIEDMDLRDEHDLPELDAIFGGIECTHHSVARGGAPINDQRRTSAWRVIDWIGRFRPQWCVFENVREFQDWGPLDGNCKKIKSKKGEIFNAWVAAIRAHGYHVEWKILNAADYGECTARNRLFIVCRRGESSEPFKWPEPTHGTSEQIAQTLATENRCSLFHHRQAHEIIDWSRDCPSIFNRKRPLADKTLRRIEIGLRKYVEPFIVKYHGGQDPRKWMNRSHSVREPLGVIPTNPRYGVAIPLLFHQGTRCEGRTVDRPFPTVMAKSQPWLAMPYMMDIHNRRVDDTSRSIDRPMPTIVAKPGNSVIMPYLLDVNHGGNAPRSYSVQRPLNTITTKRGVAVTYPYLTKFYGTGGAAPVTRPLDTITAKHRFGLTLVQTMRELGVVDIGFRMLDVDELQAAQGFPSNYILHGNKADQIRQIGNAVCPKVMAAICSNLN